MRTLQAPLKPAYRYGQTGDHSYEEEKQEKSCIESVVISGECRRYVLQAFYT